MKINVDNEDLENAIKTEIKKEKQKECKCGDDCKCDSNQEKNEEIGFHKGCLNTLVGERNELIKMIQNVESIMQAHIKRLQELGVKLEAGKKE